MVEIQIKARVLEAVVDKPYDMDGRKGVTSNVLVRVGGNVMRFKATTEAAKVAGDNLDKEVMLVCEVFSGLRMAATLRLKGVVVGK